VLLGIGIYESSISEDKGNRQQTAAKNRSIKQETKNERLFGRHQSLGAG
jgi:hypothetical protein